MLRHLPRVRWFHILAILAILMAVILKVQPVHAATITVNSDADNATAGNGLCTLREAINNANTTVDTTGGDCVVGT
ncbi:MAG: CSLREA domain-containing protein, partial [Anaerolineae bacterium]|nr:CSLREA domain-containing protein [Anaerolineae bacterium]